MRFDTVLARSDTAAIVSELDELSSTRRLTARGVLESRGRIRQFELAVDEREKWWIIRYDDGVQDSYREGIVSFRGDEPRSSDFFGPMPEPIRMLWPTRLLTWANPVGSFYPILVQRIGQRSLLFTFEHIADPAMRQTLVVDEATGIGRKLIANHRGLIITDLSGRQEWDPSLKPDFAKIDDWIRPDY